MKYHYVIPGLWSVESLCLHQSSIQKTLCSVETLYYIIVLYVLMVFLYWMWMHCVVEDKGKGKEVPNFITAINFHVLSIAKSYEKTAHFQFPEFLFAKWA